MSGYQIHITGRVQGIGFRPYIYKLANRYGINGWVRNGTNGVLIEFVADSAIAEIFYNEILNNPPKLSLIKSHSFKVIPEGHFTDFRIVDSDDNGQMTMLITPDFAICDTCKNELLDPKDHRYHYPFITCTQCGPRYSIINSLPYDRHLTAMGDFGMCDRCKEEFDNVLDRRYYSQTNSCPHCPVSMTLWKNDGSVVSKDQKDIIHTIRTLLFEENKIVAVKGIGGFLLMANACDDLVIMELRKRKERLAKPFALMYADESALRQDVHLTDEQLKVLKSPESPIVLVAIKESPQSGMMHDLVAPGLNQLGVMLPYTGLFELIMNGITSPIIATSANISNSPIVYENNEALSMLWGVADYIVTNDRDIYIPQDDSVIRYSGINKKKIVLRRSRGLAPSLVQTLDFESDQECVLSMGADMKASFCIQTNGEVYVSQYLGDLSHYSCEENYKLSLDHLLKVTKAIPNVILTDLHPNYNSTRVGQDIADKYDLPLHSIQHHKAHFASVLSENNLSGDTDGILGVIWDGTGYGEDGHIWGGEFFLYNQNTINRIGHMDYFPHISADRMSKEPRLSLISLLSHRVEELPFVRTKFSNREWTIYSELIKKNHVIQSSSMGRIFDAVACLLGLVDYNEYEGHAAMLLEKIASDHIHKYGIPDPLACVDDGGNIFSGSIILQDILQELYMGENSGLLAAKFHVSLVELVRKVALAKGLEKIAFSGGVIQNALLVDLMMAGLEKDFSLYFHKELSPNDENVSYGQLAYYHLSNRPNKDYSTIEESYLISSN